MKVVIVNTNDADMGAATAVKRLFCGLKREGVDAKMIVQTKVSDDYSILGPESKKEKLFSRIASILDRMPVKMLKTRNRTLHSPGLVSSFNFKRLTREDPDVVNLHMVNNGFLSIFGIAKIKKPLVWTLHDMWAFSGAEHYTFGDLRYEKGYLRNNRPAYEEGVDVNRRIWNLKRRSWKNVNITIVCPSNWLAQCASRSVLLKHCKIEVIPNGIDTSVFKPLDKRFCREALNLPFDKKLILFGAASVLADERKGFKYLYEAILDFVNNDQGIDVEVIVFGASEPKEKLNFGIPVRYVGRINHNPSLSFLFSAVDVFVSPTLEDNLPSTIMESLACGVPVVSFNVGGVSDMIDHDRNGYLAKERDSQDLANGIRYVLSDEDRHHRLSMNAREKIVNNFTLESQARRYINLYRDAL